MSTACPNCNYWRDLAEKAVAHAQTYGPRIAVLTIENRNLSAEIERLDKLHAVEVEERK